MPKPNSTQIDETVGSGLSDGQKLAIRLGAMAATTIAAAVASKLVEKIVDKKLEQS